MDTTNEAVAENVNQIDYIQWVKQNCDCYDKNVAASWCLAAALAKITRGTEEERTGAFGDLALIVEDLLCPSADLVFTKLFETHYPSTEQVSSLIAAIMEVEGAKN